MLRYALALIAVAASIPAPARGQEVSATYRVVHRGGGLGVTIDETVAFSVSAQHPQWVAERTRRDSNWCGRRLPDKACISTVTAAHEWIDGERCPELLRSLRALAAIRPQGFVDPEHMYLTMVSDTPLLEVTGPSPSAAGNGASLKVAAYSGPFVDWWRDTQASLKGCWSNRNPGAR